jgi:hypothetical protein
MTSVSSAEESAAAMVANGFVESPRAPVASLPPFAAVST